MKPVILYRGREFEEFELEPAHKAGFYCTNSRMNIKSGDLVVARYSCLPFYEEQERDIKSVGARLINTHAQHRYIADLLNWYEDLREFTPTTWVSAMDIPKWEEGPFILKGETNSKKHLFDTHMFAKTRADVGQVMHRLIEDSLISHQRIYIRKFEKFKTFLHGIRDLPITKEFRFFFAYGEIISGGYYWSSHVEEIEDLIANKVISKKDIDPDQVPREGFLDEIGRRIRHLANGVVVDVAQREDGVWRVVELNDLQMSGLSENRPDTLYQNLYQVIKEKA